MDEIIRVQDSFYILANSSYAASEKTHALKDGDSFGIFDGRGDVQLIGRGDQGFYDEGTRYLSYFEFLAFQRRPLLLGSHLNPDSSVFFADMTNADFQLNDEVTLPRTTLHIHRSVFLWKKTCYQHFRLKSYALLPLTAVFLFRFQADYSDIFEVRGLRRERRGEILAPFFDSEGVSLGYRGLDGVFRGTRLSFNPRPKEFSGLEARFEIEFGPHEEKNIDVVIECFQNKESRNPPEDRNNLSFDEAWLKKNQSVVAVKSGFCRVSFSDERFHRCFQHSLTDLNLLLTESESGLYPYAGIPWFSTVFGRDGILAAFSVLWNYPEIARGVLNFLSLTQAHEEDAARDAEPGKILHETRKGEMAALGEIPFSRYYGSVDSTPLFLWLAAAYFERTHDRAFIENIWPSIEMALEWLRLYGDSDGDGFIEYVQKSKGGLSQQGWKDSHDAVFHADGTLAEGPIALCEAQAYVYAAKLGVSAMAAALGKESLAARLTEEAESLRRHFEEVFWDEAMGFYVLALDGQKRPCRVRTSNPGHCLAMRIVSPERALRVADTLLSEAFFSGWGVRTVACFEPRYNPMAYHNGSIWPHDNAILALGLANYGLDGHLLKLATGLFEASVSLDLGHLPELFCGFHKRFEDRPTLYPTACSPQAWSAAAWPLILQACMGLRIQAAEKKVFVNPRLPDFMGQVTVSGLRVGDAIVRLRFSDEGSSVELEAERGEAELVFGVNPNLALCF